MKNVKFLPWVGDHYLQGIPGSKVMVLGESHYCASSADAVPELTSSVILDLFDPDSEHESYKNTYTKFERALAGKPLTFSEKRDIWNSVLFYNYVQVPISEARVSPTPQEFNSSESAFFEVLEKYQPDYILAWGSRLYNNLPKRGRQLPDLSLPSGDSFETWGYTLSSGKVVQLLSTTHPSTAFVPVYWHEVIQMFIKRRIE